MLYSVYYNILLYVLPTIVGGSQFSCKFKKWLLFETDS